jgi:uncharacterized membrane protein YjfL (UPF0719 family)
MRICKNQDLVSLDVMNWVKIKMLLQSLAGLSAFLACFCTALVAVVADLLVYTRVTAHHEFQLIRDNVASAAIALGLSRTIL